MKSRRKSWATENSYSKTDPDAYRSALKTSLLSTALCIRTPMTSTLKPHLENYEYLYQNVPESITADAGYGSQENYELLSKKGIQPYVKFNTFDKEQKATGKKSKNTPFLRNTLHYNEKEDYYVCPMGQRMDKISEGTKIKIRL